MSSHTASSSTDPNQNNTQPAASSEFPTNESGAETKLQIRQTFLALSKLELESEKIALELKKARAQDAISEAKLRLEVSELSRSPWLRPGTILPILATLGTIAFAQYQGVFNVAKERLEVANTKLQIESTKLALENRDLERRQGELNLAIRKLDAEKTLQEEVFKKIQGENAKLQNKLLATTDQLKIAADQLKNTQKAVGIAEVQAKATYPAFLSKTSLDIVEKAGHDCLPRVAPLDNRPQINSDARVEILPRPAESPLLSITPIDCFQKSALESANFRILKDADKSFLLQWLRSRSLEIEVLRLDAVRAYSDKTYAPAFGLSPTAKRPLDSPYSPVNDAQRDEWTERRRQYLIELAYKLHAAGILKGTPLGSAGDTPER